MAGSTLEEILTAAADLITDMESYEGDVPDMIAQVSSLFESSKLNLVLEKPQVEPSDELRWISNTFFLGGPTKNMTLSALHNSQMNPKGKFGDSTDLQIAGEILRRADMVDRVFYDDLRNTLAKHFANIADPVKYANPLAPDELNELV